jgi:hypothetical protein
LHTIGVPLLVTPRAPRGAQNAPGCTTGPAGRVVFVGRGVGFLVVGFGFGLTTGFLVVAVWTAGALVVAAAVGAAEVGVGMAGGGLLDGKTISGRLPDVDDFESLAAFGLSGPTTTASTVTPPQQSTARASSDNRTTLSRRRFRGGRVGSWPAAGSNHGSCGLGAVTGTRWRLGRTPSMGR